MFEHPLYFRDVFEQVIRLSMVNWQMYGGGNTLAFGLYFRHKAPVTDPDLRDEGARHVAQSLRPLEPDAL